MMKVILLETVENLGKVGDIVDIKRGFAMFLIKGDRASIATKDNLADLELKREELAKNEEAKKTIAAKDNEKINNVEMRFIEKSSADGKLYGSVTAKSLATALTQKTKVEILSTHVKLLTPIKVNGVYEVEVKIHPELSANLFVIVAKSDNDADDLLKEYKKQIAKSEERDTTK